MKEVIVLVCSVLLGVSLFGMICLGDDSIEASARNLWEKQFEMQSILFESEG